MGRDRAFEDAFLADVERLAQLQGGSGGVPVGHFTRLIRERLEIGDQRYGQRFMGRDGFGEALEEPCDAVAWALLELQRRRAAGTPADVLTEARMEIAAAAVHAARADQAIRRAQRIVAE